MRSLNGAEQLAAWAAHGAPDVRTPRSGLLLQGSDLAARALVRALEHTERHHAPQPGASIIKAQELAPI